MISSRNGEVQRAVMACGDDGVWDIVLGTILLTIGLVEFQSWPPAWVALVLLAIPLALIAKRRVTASRLLEYETRQPSAARIGGAVAILVGATLLVLLLVGLLIWLSLTSGLSDWMTDLLPIVMPVMLAFLAVVIMVTVGTLLDAAGRYSLYAGALAAGFLALLWDATPGWAAFLGPGSLMMIVGLGCTARFVRSRPLLPPEHRLRFRF